MKIFFSWLYLIECQRDSVCVCVCVFKAEKRIIHCNFIGLNGLNASSLLFHFLSIYVLLPSQWELNKIQFHLSMTRFIRVHIYKEYIHTFYGLSETFSQPLSMHTHLASNRSGRIVYSDILLLVLLLLLMMVMAMFTYVQPVLFPLYSPAPWFHLYLFAVLVENDVNKYVQYYMLMCIDFSLLKFFVCVCVDFFSLRVVYLRFATRILHSYECSDCVITDLLLLILDMYFFFHTFSCSVAFTLAHTRIHSFISVDYTYMQCF